MIPESTRRKIVDAIYKEPDLYGCQIGLYGDDSCSVLSEGYSPSVNYGRVVVVIEEAQGITGVSIDDSSLFTSSPTTVPDLPDFVANKSRVDAELLGAGLSCGFAVVAGIGVLGGAAAEIPSGGASTLLIVAAWTGFATSALQCVNGVVRSVAAVSNPDSNSLERWDNNRVYSTASLIVDALGVASAVVSLPAATRNLFAVLRRRGGLVTAEALAQMTKEERKAATRFALQRATSTPDGQAEVIQALRDAGLSEKQATQTMTFGAGTGRRATRAIKAVSEVTAARLNTSVRAVISGGLTPVVSATPSRITGSASGSVNALIIHIMNLDVTGQTQDAGASTAAGG